MFRNSIKHFIILLNISLLILAFTSIAYKPAARAVSLLNIIEGLDENDVNFEPLSIPNTNPADPENNDQESVPVENYLKEFSERQAKKRPDARENPLKEDIFKKEAFLKSSGQPAEEPEKVLEVHIEGNRLIDDDSLEKLTQIHPGDNFSQQAVVKDLSNLYSTGYFEKSSLEAQPVLTDEGVVLNYMVHENPIIVDVLIFGNRNHQDVNAYSFFQDMIGRPQNSKVFNAKIRALEAAYSEKGYLLAKVKKALWDKDIGVFKIYIDEGYLSEIQYEGNFKTKKHFLDRKLAHTSSKHAYNEKEFYKDYQSLNKTGYFKKIEREIIPNEDGHGYVLKLNLEEKRSIKVGVGGGVNSGTGLFGNSTLKVSNIRGEGQDFQLSGTFGSGIGANSAFNDSQFFRQATLTTIGATYNIPYVFGSDKNLGLYANYTQGANFQVDFSEQLSLATGISVSRVFGEDDNHFLKNSFGLNYIDLDEVNRFEERRYVRDIARNYTEFFDVGQNYVPGVGDPAVSPFALRAARELREDQLIQGQFINFKSAYSFTKLDDLQNPHEGWKSQLSLEPVLGFSEVDSFTKFSGSVSRYVGLPKNSSFLVNGRWGYDVLGSIPQFAQYRLGGNSGVRGYRQFSQLGLGTTQAISTVELRTPIYNVIPQLKRNKYLKNLDLAAFTDIGVVGGSTDFNRLTDRLSQAWSAGVGVRVAVPFFGRIRVDLGFPIIDALYNKDFFRINFGPADNF